MLLGNCICGHRAWHDIGEKMPNFYTVILEFDEGNFLRQVYGADALEALQAWCGLILEQNNIPGLDIPKIMQLKGIISRDSIVPITGTKKAWCFSFLVDDVFGWGNIIETAQ